MTGSDDGNPTVADLAACGIDEVKALCLRCGRTWRSPIFFLPPTTALRKVGDLMVCPSCGGREIEVEPGQGGDRIVH